MKFLCDNCKAKYQIGDEKVAGKTVRMKCRRCGHLIQVSASVTESSVARRPPSAPPPAGGYGTRAPVPPAPPPPHVPGSLASADDDDEKTTIMKSPPRFGRVGKPKG